MPKLVQGQAKVYPSFSGGSGKSNVKRQPPNSGSVSVLFAATLAPKNICRINECHFIPHFTVLVTWYLVSRALFLLLKCKNLWSQNVVIHPHGLFLAWGTCS